VSKRNNLQGIRILVLEDDPDQRYLLSFRLESEGASVPTAQNVPEAIEALKSNRPDVVVADIALPGQDGYAFIAALRREENPELRTTPVIALTAMATTPARREEALNAGFDDYFAKPVDLGHLTATIKQLYNRRLDRGNFGLDFAA
jgi:CheY-like chemotaxis protein